MTATDEITALRAQLAASEHAREGAEKAAAMATAESDERGRQLLDLQEKLAAERAAREEAADRLITIMDEEFGLQPPEPDKSMGTLLTSLERLLFERRCAGVNGATRRIASCGHVAYRDSETNCIAPGCQNAAYLSFGDLNRLSALAKVADLERQLAEVTRERDEARSRERGALAGQAIAVQRCDGSDRERDDWKRAAEAAYRGLSAAEARAAEARRLLEEGATLVEAGVDAGAWARRVRERASAPVVAAPRETVDVEAYPGEKLTFEAFSAANRLRCERDFGRKLGTRDADVSMLIGLSEEAGEVAGKMRTLLGFNKRKSTTPVEVGEEIGGLITFADLLASSIGLSLVEVLVSEFNRVSERAGSSVRISPVGDGGVMCVHGLRKGTCLGCAWISVHAHPPQTVTEEKPGGPTCHSDCASRRGGGCDCDGGCDVTEPAAQTVSTGEVATRYEPASAIAKREQNARPPLTVEQVLAAAPASPPPSEAQAVLDRMRAGLPADVSDEVRALTAKIKPRTGPLTDAEIEAAARFIVDGGIGDAPPSEARETPGPHACSDGGHGDCNICGPETPGCQNRIEGGVLCGAKDGEEHPCGPRCEVGR